MDMETITRFYSSKGDDNDMRDGIVYVDGKRLDLDACEELYGDGKFHGSRRCAPFAFQERHFGLGIMVELTRRR